MVSCALVGVRSVSELENNLSNQNFKKLNKNFFKKIKNINKFNNFFIKKKRKHEII